MKKSELLREAKWHLVGKNWSCIEGFDRSTFICVATGLAARRLLRRYDHLLKMQLQDWIQDALLGGMAFEFWLEKYHPEWQGDIQELRHKWLDWMVAYWESKGD